MKKILLVIVISLFLVSCNNKEVEIDPLEIVSLDNSKVRVDQEYIYVMNGLSESDIYNVISSKSDSRQSYEILNNTGEIKTSNIIYDFDILRISSNESDETLDLFIIFVNSFE